MNPQSKWLEINQEVFTSVWDNMPAFYRQVVSNDTEHKTKIFDNFYKFVDRETNQKFREWENSIASYSPSNADGWLNDTASFS